MRAGDNYGFSVPTTHIHDRSSAKASSPMWAGDNYGFSVPTTHIAKNWAAPP